jgi:hypothetical protein
MLERIQNMEAEDIRHLLRQMDLASADFAEVTHWTQHEDTIRLGTKTVELKSKTKLNFTKGNCTGLLNLSNEDLDLAEQIEVTWEDNKKRLRIHDCKTKVTLTGFTQVPFDPRGFPYCCPKEVILELRHRNRDLF